MNPIYPPVYRSSIIVRNPSHNRCSPKSKSKLSVWRIVDGFACTRCQSSKRSFNKRRRNKETRKKRKRPAAIVKAETKTPPDEDETKRKTSFTAVTQFR